MPPTTSTPSNRASPPSGPPTHTQTTLLTTRLLTLARQRAYPKTLCPSEVARSFTGPELRDELEVAEWRDLMPRLREICFELSGSGEVEVLQRGEVVVVGGDRGRRGEDVRGPVRVRLAGGGGGG